MAMSKAFSPALRKALRDLLGPEARGMTPTRMGVPNAEKFSLDDPKFGGGPMVGGTPEALARAREQGWNYDSYHATGPLARPGDAELARLQADLSEKEARFHQLDGMNRFATSRVKWTDVTQAAAEYRAAQKALAVARRAADTPEGFAAFERLPGVASKHPSAALGTFLGEMPEQVDGFLPTTGRISTRIIDSPGAAGGKAVQSMPEYSEGAMVMPTIARMQNPYRMSGAEWVETLQSKQNPLDYEALQRRLSEYGHDGIVIEPSPLAGAEHMGRQFVVFDPKNIRSRFAAFDPSKKDSSDLLASALLGTTAGAAALGLSAEDAEAMNIGAAAKTWNKVAAKSAKAMEKAGAGREQIFKETGTFRGLDGKWRQEIDDSQASLTGVEKGRLSEVLDHPALFEAYPKLARLPTKIGDSDYAEGFHFALPGFRRLEIKGPTDQKRLSGVLHEAQHAVQDAEGFSPGGSPMPMWLRPAKMRKEYGHVDAFKFYERLPGEMEARLTQARQPLDAALRRELYPLVQPNSYADQQAYGPHGLDYHPADAIQGYKRESPWLTLAKAGGYGYGAYKLAEATLGDEADARPMPRFAAFDPSKKDSSDLLAGLAAGIISLPMLRAALAERRERRA